MEKYQLQEAHDLRNEREEDRRCRCSRCDGAIWEDEAIYYNDEWICWECESDFWQDIREDFLARTA